MRVKNSISVAEFRNRHADGSAITLDAPAMLSPVEVRPSKDETKLNKMEKAWLEVLRNRGYPWVGVQCVSLKIGDDCRYNPDFLTVSDGRLVAWETKGFMRDDALVKLKTAARQFPWLVLVLVKKERGQWIEQEIKP